VRPFFVMPPVEQRLPGSELRREYDLPLPDSGRWWFAGLTTEGDVLLPQAAAASEAGATRKDAL